MKNLCILYTHIFFAFSSVWFVSFIRWFIKMQTRMKQTQCKYLSNTNEGYWISFARSHFHPVIIHSYLFIYFNDVCVCMCVQLVNKFAVAFSIFQESIGICLIVFIFYLQSILSVWIFIHWTCLVSTYFHARYYSIALLNYLVA